jgi:hypothetical protein
MSLMHNKLRTIIHTTPVLRQVSQGFANTFGLGSMYTDYDKEIGYGQEPAATDHAVLATGPALESYYGADQDDDEYDDDEEYYDE